MMKTDCSEDVTLYQEIVKLRAKSRSTSTNGGAENGATHHQETPEVPTEVQKILQKIRSAAKTIDLSFLDMKDEEAREIGEAIASSQALEELTLQLDSLPAGDEQEEDKERPSEIVLTTAFLCDHPNTSVRTLIIEASGTDGDMMRLGSLSPVLRENKNLTKLEILWHGDDGTTRSETQEFFDSLLQNTTLRTLVLPSLVRWDFDDSEDGGFIDAETFSQIVKLVKENKSIDNLQLFIGECRGPGSQDLNLPGFYAALKSNSTIKTLHLRGDFITRDAESDFLEWIERTRSLEELHLDPLENYYDADADDVPLRYNLFFRSLRNNKSLKKLVLDGTIIDEEESFQEFMDAIKGNSTLREIVFDPDNDRGEAVQELLQSRAATSPERDPAP
ncbi:hypothetical protein R1sor_004760 [Riccia sorocarpa]|uniref:Uncharacterized protein n=1 Tax=Riccia sorocarpa TaxID=122646 RepID=A0ABD3HL48_9MARC